MNQGDFRKPVRMEKVGEILKKFDPRKDKYISREFQFFGCYLAETLGDLKHKSLYIKLAKEIRRATLEEALSFVKAAGDKVRSRPRLFMWKLKEMGVLKKKKKKKKKRKKSKEGLYKKTI